MKGKRAFLFGLRADGSPTCHPMVGIEQDGALHFNTYRTSAKAQNFLREPRAAAVVLDDWTTPPAEAKTLAGVMHEVEPPVAPGSEAAGGEVAASGPATVPASVTERVQRRVSTNKRMYFRLRTEA